MDTIAPGEANGKPVAAPVRRPLADPRILKYLAWLDAVDQCDSTAMSHACRSLRAAGVSVCLVGSVYPYGQGAE